LAWTSPALSGVTLEQAYQSAAQHHLELRVAEEQTLQARSAHWEAVGAHLPHLWVESNAAFNGFEVTVPTELLADPTADLLPLVRNENLDLSIYAVQPLLRPSLWMGISAARASWVAATQDEARVRSTMRIQVARVFFGVLAARQALDLATERVAVATDGVDQVHTRVGEGLQTRREALQAEIALSQSRRALADARATLAEAEAGWRQVVGISEFDELVIPQVPVLPSSLEAALAARVGRPDVAAAQSRTKAARRVRAAHDAQWLPTIDLAFRERLNATPTLFDPLPSQWNLGLVLRWDVFDAGRFARSRAQGSQARVAAMAAERQVLQADDDIRIAWHRWEQAQAELVAVGLELELTDRDMALAVLSEEAGTATPAELRRSRLAHLAARLGVIQANLGVQEAALDLQLAMGSRGPTAGTHDR